MHRIFLYIMLFMTAVFVTPLNAQAGEHTVDDLKVLADGGNHDAQYKLGKHYMTGKGVEQDIKKALQLFMTSAGHGYPKSQYILGKFYRDGIYFKQSEKNATEWFNKAAKQGDGNAQYALAVIYARHRNAPDTIMHSYAWFSVLVSRGHPKAASGRNEVAKYLDKHQIVEAKRIAIKYYTNYVVPFRKNKKSNDNTEIQRKPKETAPKKEEYNSNVLQQNETESEEKTEHE